MIITKNEKEIKHLISKEVTISYVTDELTGILKGNYDLDQTRKEKLTEKCQIAD